jgi:hypothetical protein
MKEVTETTRNKVGRKPLPIALKAVTTSLRLRPDRLAVYKRLGGIRWLNAMLDMLDVKAS